MKWGPSSCRPASPSVDVGREEEASPGNDFFSSRPQFFPQFSKGPVLHHRHGRLDRKESLRAQLEDKKKRHSYMSSCSLRDDVPFFPETNKKDHNFSADLVLLPSASSPTALRRPPKAPSHSSASILRISSINTSLSSSSSSCLMPRPNWMYDAFRPVGRADGGYLNLD